jgi:hypothetical protein
MTSSVCTDSNWDQLATHLGWDGDSDIVKSRILENWECMGPSDGGLMFRKRAGIDGDSWPPENLYFNLKVGQDDTR